MKTFKTKQVADEIGVHPNTVRLYEEIGFIPKPVRHKNGYRMFTELHIEQMKFGRLALKGEVLQNGLRKKAVEIIKLSAEGEYDKAIINTEEYREMLDREISHAEEAVKIVENILSKQNLYTDNVILTRKQTADSLDITMDTLRNWEMNGLLKVRRKENGYRVYTSENIKQLKIIRSLRCANYSLSSILRLLNDLSTNKNVNIKQSIDTPKESEDIISVCDILLTSLSTTKKDAEEMLFILKNMKDKFSNPPV